MYKLFLCLWYLHRKALAYAAMASVALCVALMLIVISVMNGFLDKVEEAAKGLFGDIVIDSGSQHGIPLYDEFIAAVRKDVPEVLAGSPFILSYGILRVPGDANYRQAVQIAGIRLPQRVEVSEFGKGLFVQAGVQRPTFDPPVGRIADALARETKEVEAILKREQASDGDGTESMSKADLLDRLRWAIHRQQIIRRQLLQAAPQQQEMRRVHRRLKELRRRAGDEPSAEQLERIRRLEEEMARLEKATGLLSPDYRLVLGLGIQGLSIRTRGGETIRLLSPSQRVVLYVFPLGRLTRADMTPNVKPFTIIDDCKTDVSSIDSEFVYVPFETLQKLNNMDMPDRCSQLHFKVAQHLGGEKDLRRIAAEIEEVWAAFRRGEVWRRFEAENPDMEKLELGVQTWRQRQARVVAPIESQRTLVVTMFGIISLVALVLIFVIFYMIVVQKTRDIGVLKSIGASSGGVAWIFLGYGAAVGLVGSIVGTIGGYFFVRNINPIHDAIGRWLGFQVWSREWFLFEKIPNDVQWPTAVIIVLSAIAAGLVGALVPALKAARMQPVEALRYE